MGMAVQGRRPASRQGKHFDAPGLEWSALAELSQHFAPKICSACKYWDSNDGDGLNADGAKHLAAGLAQALAAGEIDAYLAERDKKLAALPDEICEFCNGTGVRTDAVGVKYGQPEQVIDEPGHPRIGQTGWCNGCNGRGWNEAFERLCRVERERVVEWIAFLKECGGFNIY